MARRYHILPQPYPLLPASDIAAQPKAMPATAEIRCGDTMTTAITAPNDNKTYKANGTATRMWADTLNRFESTGSI